MQDQYQQIQKMRIKEATTKKVRDQISKNIETTMIGALDAFEQAFYPLLDVTKSVNDMTEEEARMYNCWQQARRTILDLGNHQKYRSLELLSRYDIEPITYVTEFLIKKK